MPVAPRAEGRVWAEDVLARLEGGLEEMPDEERAENAALAERHEHLLRAHGYRLVRLPCCAAPLLLPYETFVGFIKVCMALSSLVQAGEAKTLGS